MYFIFQNCAQILMFDTKSSQIARTFLWPFSWTFGLAYSPLNSATLNCSSEVTLTFVYNTLVYLVLVHTVLCYLLHRMAVLWIITAAKVHLSEHGNAHWDIIVYEGAYLNRYSKEFALLQSATMNVCIKNTVFAGPSARTKNSPKSTCSYVIFVIGFKLYWIDVWLT